MDKKKHSLEDIVKLTNDIGIQYADAKKKAERLELLRSSVRAKIAIRFDDGSITETKLRRLTESDVEYTSFIDELTDAKCECEKLRIRYESYKNLFEARRSMLSYQKAEMKLL